MLKSDKDFTLKDDWMTSGYPKVPSGHLRTKSTRFLYSIDQQYYNTIRNDDRKRGYDHSYFAPMVYNGVESLEKLIREFNRVIPRSWTKERKINFVLAFVTLTVNYEYDKTTGYDEYYKHPIETITEDVGDCEDTSILFASILSGLGFESALFAIPPIQRGQPGHIAVGVKGDFSGYYVNYKRTKYFFCETAADRTVHKVGMMNEKYKNALINVMPITRQPVPPQKVKPSTDPPTPKSPDLLPPEKYHQKGIELYIGTRYNEAREFLQLALSGLKEPKKRAEIYIYLGYVEYAMEMGTEKKAENRAKNRFEQALRQLPDGELPHDHPRFTPWFKDVYQNSIGELTVTTSPPQAEIWISGNGLERKKLSTRTRSTKLFKGNYTVEGVYDGRSIEQNVYIRPNSSKRFHIEIPLDDQPPEIVLRDPIQTVEVDQRFRVTAEVTDDTAVESVVLYYAFSRSETKPSRYNKETDLTETASDLYAADLRSPEAGYFWYYLTATDREGNESESRVGKVIIKRREPPPDSQPPTIVELSVPEVANVNQRIRVRARVRDDTGVKSVYLFYGFSNSRASEPTEYERTPLEEATSDWYAGHIPSQNAAGYIWCYFRATDKEANKVDSGKFSIRIRRDSPEKPTKKPSTVSMNKPITYQAFGFNYSTSIFKGNWEPSFNLGYWREVKTHQTFGAQARFDFSDHSFSNLSNMNATLQWNSALGESFLGYTLLGGGARYRIADKSTFHTTPILGMGVTLYPFDRVAIEAICSFQLPSNVDKTDFSDLFYHYEIGAYIGIINPLYLKIDYSEFNLAGERSKRWQAGLGITF